MKEHSIDIQLSHPDDLFHLWFQWAPSSFDGRRARCGWFMLVRRLFRFWEKKLLARKLVRLSKLWWSWWIEEWPLGHQMWWRLLAWSKTMKSASLSPLYRKKKSSRIIQETDPCQNLRSKELYVDSVKQHDVTFGIGPAGTGKTLSCSDFGVTALNVGSQADYPDSSSSGSCARVLGFLRAILGRRSILIFDQFTMPCIRFSAKTKRLVPWSVRLSKSRPLPICVVGPWMMPLSFSMKHKIRPSCRWRCSWLV